MPLKARQGLRDSVVTGLPQNGNHEARFFASTLLHEHTTPLQKDFDLLATILAFKICRRVYANENWSGSQRVDKIDAPILTGLDSFAVDESIADVRSRETFDISAKIVK